ncbi:MAG: hypothetical protein AB8B64_14155 [Granulosicoccus sp.]
MSKLVQFAILVFTFTISQVTVADGKRQRGFSFLAAGLSLVDYEESSTFRFNGQTVDVETDSVQLVTQSSGVFVSINDKWGFYLQSSSTLGVPRSSERWEINEQQVRTNRVSFEQQDIVLIATKHISDTSRWLLGGGYQQFEFQRFAAQLTPSAPAFGIDEAALVDGTVSEVVTYLTGVVGLETSTLFDSNLKGWRYRAQAVLTVPALTTINNTSVAQGRSFSQSLNGAGLILNGTIGYQLNNSILIGAQLTARVRHQNAISREVEGIGGQTRFPETRFVSIQPAFTAYWSFQ